MPDDVNATLEHAHGYRSQGWRVNADQETLDYNAHLPQAARFYVEGLGLRVVPVGFQEKVPCIGKFWLSKVETTPPLEMLRWFRAPGNVGFVPGHLSAGMVDVDLDCLEALDLAQLVLESTWTFGRASKPRSHYVYRCADAVADKFTYRGTTLLELRCDSESGRPIGHTVLPPSVHPSGERIFWTEDCDAQDAPRVTTPGELTPRVQLLAAACLVARCAGLEAARLWLGDDHQPPPAFCPPGCEHKSTTGAKACPTMLVREWIGVGNVPRTVTQPVRARTQEETEDIKTAVEAFNRAAAPEYPAVNGPCPVCGSPGGFKASGTPGRWACFSARHQEVGLEGASCWTGDALDLAAATASLPARSHQARRIAILKRDKFLKVKGGQP